MHDKPTHPSIGRLAPGGLLVADAPVSRHGRPRSGRPGAMSDVVEEARRRAPMQQTTAKTLPDDALIRRFQSGVDCEGALLALFERYGGLTYGFLRRRIGDAEIAAELNQELYICVMQSLDRFRRDSSFKTWLFQLAHHLLSNQRRRWRVHLDELPDATPDELAEVLPGMDQAQPDEELDKAERARALHRCMAALPEVQRIVIVGLYYEGVTLRELTERLKLSNKSGARASLIAGQRKLRYCLERAGVDAELGLSNGGARS